MPLHNVPKLPANYLWKLAEPIDIKATHIKTIHIICYHGYVPPDYIPIKGVPSAKWVLILFGFHNLIEQVYRWYGIFKRE